jgi:hypothetical protein
MSGVESQSRDPQIQAHPVLRWSTAVPAVSGDFGWIQSSKIADGVVSEADIEAARV